MPTPEVPKNKTEAVSAAGLGVLDKAMALLNIVSAGHGPMTYTELLHASGLPKATLHRILATLVRERLLRIDPYNRTYQLGFRLLELAHEVWSDFDLRIAAQDELVRLRDAIGETVLLVVLDATAAVVVAAQEGGRDAVAAPRAGTRLPLHASAAGKAILGALDHARQATLLQALPLSPSTQHTLRTHAALQAELDLARARGYAIEDRERSDSETGAGAPIYDYEGRVIGAVAVVAKAARADAARVHGWSSTLIGAARAITHSAAGEAMSIEPASHPPAADATIAWRCVDETRSLLGEGPIWSPRDHALYWVDILAPALHTWREGEPAEPPVRMGAMASVAIPKASGGLLLATPAGLMGFDPASKRLHAYTRPEGERPENRYNDGKCDRRGRLWIASMDMAATPHRGNLYRVDADGRWQRMDSGFTVPNGLGWSPDDRTMYFTDTWRRTIYAYDFDLAAGTLGRRSEFIVFDEKDGKPDGLTVDEQGCVWVALWDAAQVARYAPDGRELLRVRLPVPRPTSCCFGGANLETLYVTTASVRLSQQALDAAPLSGALFALEPGVRGLPEPMFAG